MAVIKTGQPSNQHEPRETATGMADIYKRFPGVKIRRHAPSLYYNYQHN